MAQLEIKGHKTRGKEVIALLEMLGGKNDTVTPYDGSDDTTYYRILKDGSSRIVSSHYVPNKRGVGYRPYTLEQFEEEFPYKVENYVRLGVLDKVRIVNAYWDSCSDQVIYEALSVHDSSVYDNLHAKQLSTCKEEPSPDKAKAPSLEGQDYSEGRCGYKIPEGFEFDKVENGEIILKPKKKELPKTYEKCCEELGFSSEGDIVYSGQWIYGYEYLGRHLKALRPFSKLLVCRDAYWKLADDWKPGWNGYNGDSGLKYCIFQDGSTLRMGDTISRGCVLMFPTKEIRDTFFENFKDLICECKELL